MLSEAKAASSTLTIQAARNEAKEEENEIFVIDQSPARGGKGPKVKTPRKRALPTSRRLRRLWTITISFSSLRCEAHAGAAENKSRPKANGGALVCLKDQHVEIQESSRFGGKALIGSGPRAKEMLDPSKSLPKRGEMSCCASGGCLSLEIASAFGCPYLIRSNFRKTTYDISLDSWISFLPLGFSPTGSWPQKTKNQESIER